MDWLPGIGAWLGDATNRVILVVIASGVAFAGRALWGAYRQWSQQRPRAPQHLDPFPPPIPSEAPVEITAATIAANDAVIEIPVEMAAAPIAASDAVMAPPGSDSIAVAPPVLSTPLPAHPCPPSSASRLPPARAPAGRTVTARDDVQPGVGLRPDGWPDILWVRIPGTASVRASGLFPKFPGLRLGSGARPDRDAADDELWPADALPLEVADFELAAYPLTVAQYKPFVDQGGYREDRHWSEAGRRLRDREDWREPRYWDNPALTVTDQPVVGISWYEAEAYCHWLNECLSRGVAVRLPTEAEWEWAARGPQNRRYPWGDQWEAGRCTGSEAGIGGASAVGSFPGGAAGWWRAVRVDSETVHDLAGSVWEWTASEYSRNYAGAQRSVLNADADPDGLRTLRGGSWSSGPGELRAAARQADRPEVRRSDLGFRLARNLTF